jgi:cell division topological specificity factor
MNILRLFSSRPAPEPAPATAPIARERLQILLAHERGSIRGQPDLLMKLREEILAVVSRHVTLDPDKVMVRMERGKNVSTLEVDIELPNGCENALAKAV